MDSDGFDFISAIMMINSRNDHVCVIKIIKTAILILHECDFVAFGDSSCMNPKSDFFSLVDMY